MAQGKPAWEQIKAAWHWLWYDDSVLSWVVSIGVAFVLIKFVIYPLLGLVMGTTFPVVAVVSDSMEHNEPLDTWWNKHEDLYLRYNITRQEYLTYPMQKGFDKGDIIVLVGVASDEVKRGDIIVYWGGRAYPIIHRVVGIDQVGAYRYYATKGDNNLGQIIEPNLDERHIPYERPCAEGTCSIVLGKAVVRIPWLGWVKIGFVDLLRALGIPIA
jgi:signal peptidase I